MDLQDSLSVPQVGEMPRGRFSAKVDDKGRIKLPTVFQDYLKGLSDSKLFVTSTDRHTAAIYPIAVWQYNEKRLESLPAKVARVISFNANDLGAECAVDANGRLPFNTDLRKALGIEEGKNLHLYRHKGHIKVITDAEYQKEVAASVSADIDQIMAEAEDGKFL